LHIAKRFFHIDEYKKIVSNVENNKLFFDYWTKKESFIKALGKGMTMSLQTFKVDIENGKVVELNGEKTNYYTSNFYLDDSYSAAVCIENKFEFSCIIEVYGIADLYKKFIDFL
jgi:4'-phosphopantetheinyl transferase